VVAPGVLRDLLKAVPEVGTVVGAGPRSQTAADGWSGKLNTLTTIDPALS
jgi:hypothetical protein